MQLVRAMSTLLEFNPQEEQHVKDYLEYRVGPFNNSYIKMEQDRLPSLVLYLGLAALLSSSSVIVHILLPSPFLGIITLN